MAYTAEKRLYLNADKSRVVEEGSPEAAFLFAAEGTPVSDADARKYGLGEHTPESPAEAPQTAESAESKAEEPTEDKAVASPDFRTRRAGR